MDETKLARQIERDEGRKNTPYPDSRGYLSIGVGRCLVTNPLSEDEINYLFANDLRTAKEGAASFLGKEIYLELDRDAPVRLAVVVNMSFNLGNRLRGFVRFREAVQARDWKGAAAEMKDSTWYKQVGKRADRLIQQMLTGVWVL